MDTLLSITAGALFLIGSITIFNKAMSKSGERAITSEATLIVQSVRSLYQNQVTYGDATSRAWTVAATSGSSVSGALSITRALSDSRQLLNEMNNGTGLRNAFGGSWTVDGLLDAFAITATNVPRENCSAILAALNTSDLRHMTVISTAANDACVENGGQTPACPATPPAITTACAAGATNGHTTIRLVYR